MKVLKIVLFIIGVLLGLMGLIWFLQGINLLSGSMMSGKIEWVIYGVIAFLAGIILILAVSTSGHKA
jgi:predicted membrane channel-forming protein YqfA (hemolysin III family)